MADYSEEDELRDFAAWRESNTRQDGVCLVGLAEATPDGGTGYEPGLREFVASAADNAGDRNWVGQAACDKIVAAIDRGHSMAYLTYAEVGALTSALGPEDCRWDDDDRPVPTGFTRAIYDLCRTVDGQKASWDQAMWTASLAYTPDL